MLYCICQQEKGGESEVQKRVSGNEYRLTVVCIDSYREGVLAGRFYNPYVPAGESFQSLTQFLRKMEDLLDGMSFPQSFTAARGFTSPPEVDAAQPPDESPREGRLATFGVRVLFRQNASWQGAVSWLEGGREESFRSVLELILLMDSVLAEAELPRSEAREEVRNE